MSKEFNPVRVELATGIVTGAMTEGRPFRWLPDLVGKRRWWIDLVEADGGRLSVWDGDEESEAVKEAEEIRLDWGIETPVEVIGKEAGKPGLSPETIAFLEQVRRAASDCADIYSIDDGLPADAPPEVAEAYWEIFLDTVREQVGGMCGRLCATPEWVAAVQDIAVNAVFDRLYQLGQMPEGGRA